MKRNWLGVAIKNEEKNWAEAMRAGDVAEMVRSSARMARMKNNARTLRAARRELAPVLKRAS